MSANTKDWVAWLVAVAVRTAEYLDVTPEMARLWLENNPDNRPVSQRDVDAYARDMLAGKWRETNEGIGFGRAGELYDGQHRLWAIVECGRAVRMLVVRGLAEEDRPAINVGRKRTMAHQLAMFGHVPNAKQVFSLANATHRLVYATTPALTYDDVMDWYARVGADARWGATLMCGDRATGVKRVLVQAPVVAGLAFARRRDAAVVEDVTERMLSGAGLAAGDAALTLREYLLGLTRDQRGAVASDDARAVTLKVLRAVKYAAEKQAVSKLQLGEDGFRWCMTAHDAGTLPPSPKAAGAPKGAGEPNRPAALLEGAQSLQGVARVANFLADSGLDTAAVVAWCLANRRAVPSLARYQVSHAATLVRQALDRRARLRGPAKPTE